MTIKELRDKAAKLHNDMTELSGKAHKEGRLMTKEENECWDRMDSDYNQLVGELQRREKLEAQERYLTAPQGGGTPQSLPVSDPVENTEEIRKKQDKAFERWIRGGEAAVTPELRPFLRRPNGDYDTRTVSYTAQTVTTTGGGYLIAPAWIAELERSLKAYGGVRQVARVITTPTGANIPYPTVDDTSNVGELVAINTECAAAQVVYGVKNFGAYKFSSKAVLVPLELLQDSDFPIVSHLTSLLTERIGRITNTYFTTGTGSSQPQGCAYGSTLGYTGVTGTDTSITYTGLVEMEHSLDPAYRPAARWMFRDSALKEIKKLTDDMLRPLWMPSVAGGQPDTILGYPYTVNQDVTAFAAETAKTLLFGDFSKYIIRDVMPPELFQMREKYIESGQVAFIMWSRHDGGLINTAAIKHYKNGAAS